MPVSQPVDPKSDLARSWKSYQETEQFATNKKWIMDYAPDVWPRQQQEQFVMGGLWGAFMAGFKAGQEYPETQPDEVEKRSVADLSR